MGKYFKEDSNQRLSQISDSIDVDLLAKRLIMAQGGLFQVFKTPAKVIQTSKPPKGSFYAKNPAGDYTKLEPNKARNLVVAPGAGTLGKIIGFFLPAKIKNIINFIEEVIPSGTINKTLSKIFDGNKINTALEKEYVLQLKGKSKTREVKLKDLLLKYNPETGVIDGQTYKFTPQQIDEIYADMKMLSDQSDKWVKIKAGTATGFAATGIGAMNIEQGVDRSKPEVKDIQTKSKSITDKSQSNYDDSSNPIDKKLRP